MSAVKMPGTGLEDVGVPGQSFLRDALTSCTDPLKAIEEFQVIVIPFSAFAQFFKFLNR
jgi:hypothetical protein